jgi:predicted nuclease of restriction endonuclease-like (RecB) superfamily
MGPDALPRDYALLLRDLKDRIQAARTSAALSVNREMIALYWDIGRQVVEKQKAGGWGRGVIERLSQDIRAAFPGIKGFSRRNIQSMRLFFQAWPGLGAKCQQPVGILEEAVDFIDNSLIPQQPVAKLPWGHNLVLLQDLRTPEDRLWYARQALENGWSRAVLQHQIDSRLHLRQGKAQTNFKATLPAPQSALAQELLKDDYALDFLATPDSRERELERNLVAHVQKLLLELGAGFAFVGRQHHLEVGGEDFYLDLLFYHTRLHCYVVIELKAGRFKPEFAGKMSFYLAAADDLLRRPGDGPSIGIILCREKNRVVAEYALSDMARPIGVSSYRLTRALPEELEGKLPSIGELEARLS